MRPRNELRRSDASNSSYPSSGFSYILDLPENVNDNDEAFDKDGLSVVCDPKSYLYLNGTTIDFKDEVMGRGFVFSNPNATSTCGCGSSFQA